MFSNMLARSGSLARMAGLTICLGSMTGCIGASGGQDDGGNSGTSSGGGSSGGGSTIGSGDLRLSSTTFSVDENGGSLTIPVQRVGESEGEVSVEYSTRQLDTSDGSHARDADFGNGDDYEGTSGTLIFPDGVTEREFTVSITDDGEDNPDLTFEVYLLNPSTSTTQPNVATVTIVDDDDASASTGSATIHWTAPTSRLDGSALSLSQIDGYKVYEGTSTSDLSRIATVNDSSSVDVTVNGLASGTHYFAVSATDTDGLEGPQSKPVSFTVP